MAFEKRESVVAEIRRAIAEGVSRPEGVAPEVRRRALDIVRSERAEGRTAASTARLLGVHVTTLSRWARAAVRGSRAQRGIGSTPKFREVQVTEAPVVMPPPVRSGLRIVHSRSGLVVDGLDVDTVAALLGRLS